MASRGTVAGENAGKISRPTPPDAPLHQTRQDETKGVGDVHSVETEGDKEAPAGEKETPASPGTSTGR